jgi:ribosomal protein L18E
VVNRVAGRGSVLRALPVGVIVAAYNVSASDAVKIKNSGGN